MYSDSAGLVIIDDSIWRKGKLYVSYMGYETKTVGLNAEMHEVFLAKIEKKLDDVVVIPCKNYIEEEIGVLTKKTNFGFGYSWKTNGFMWASFIPNKTGKHGFVESLTFCSRGSKKGSKIHAPIRYAFLKWIALPACPARDNR